MRLNGRRESSNFEDRRGMSGGQKVAGMGIGGLIIAGIISLLMGGNPLDLLQQMGGLNVGETTEVQGEYQSTPEEEEQVLLSPINNLSAMLGMGNVTVCADQFLKDGQKFEVAGVPMQFILTPGHTPGSGCFYVKDANLLFSGDTIFYCSRGRTDFPGGSEAQLLKSIREKLLVLPEETDVFAGHMEQTTIGNEKRIY